MVCVCPRFDRTLGRSQKVLNGSIRVSGITGTTPGADIVAVKELLGHKSMQMTLRYAHLAPSHKVAAISLLDGDPNPPPAQNYTKTIQSVVSGNGRSAK